MAFLEGGVVTISQVITKLLEDWIRNIVCPGRNTLGAGGQIHFLEDGALVTVQTI